MKNENKKFKKEEYIERYEKNLIIAGLFIFIILGVIFFVFVLPKISGLHGSYNENDKKNSVKYSVDKNSPEGNYQTGMKFVDQNNHSSALDYFEKAARSDPDNTSYLTELAITHYRLKNYRESIEIYEKIINLDESNASLYNNTGNIYWIIKDMEEAEYYFKKAIEFDASLIAPYSNLALMFDENERREEAIEILRQGIVANPGNIELKMTLRVIEN